MAVSCQINTRPQPPAGRRLKRGKRKDVWLVNAWRALLGALDGEGLLSGKSFP